MNNLGAREKYGFMLLGIVVLVFLIYFFGIRSAQANYDYLVNERSQLQATLEYYEQLKTQNADAENEIQLINDNIAAIETQFLPVLNSEAIEQYVLDVFESNGCPYLVSAATEDVVAEQIYLPDGTLADDSILIKRLTVTYSTTDGFNIPQYNLTDFTTSEDGLVNMDLVAELVDTRMYWQGMEGIEGYDEFVAALEQIEAENQDCVKIFSVSAKEEAGYVLMTASIDFYSATFTQRVSQANTNAPYITYAGATNVDTDGGFIGMPFYVDDPNSVWYGVYMTDDDATAGDRPFAAYFSNVIFSDAVDNFGLGATLDAGEPAPVEEPAA